MKKNDYIKICSVCILIILILLVLFYLFDVKKIDVQQYLNNVYINDELLKQQFHHYINENPTIKKENEFVFIENVLNPDYFDYLKQQFAELEIDPITSIGRKASGVNFTKLHQVEHYRGLLELFYSSELSDFLKEILKKPIHRPPLSDDNACSLLIYSKKGDYIDWHKDYSNYNGDRYVVLITLVNENKEKTGLSENEFFYMHDHQEHSLKMKENSMVIFQGSEIYHKSTAIGEDETRVLLSMVFCDICQEKKNIATYLYEKIKNAVVYNN